MTQNSDPITDELLDGVDVVWFGNREVEFTPTEIGALSSWIVDGGAILIEADTEGSRTHYNTLLEGIGSGIVYWSMSGLSGITANIHPHEMTVGVETIFLPTPGKTLGVTPPAAKLIDDLTNRTVVACDVVGEGRIVVMTDHLFHDVAIGTADNRVFANRVFTWFYALSWLNVTPTSGTLEAGGAVGLQVTIDATGLSHGSYRQNIDIRSNDPAVPVTTVPVCVTVDSTVSATAIDPVRLPTEYALRPNYPNPFNPTTTIAYDLPEKVRVRLVIYDVVGREVRTLADEIQSRGRYAILWDGRNTSGEVVASGVYLYRLAAGEFAQTRKMLLLK